AIDFGLIVDGAVIIVENCLRRLGERQHELGRRLTLAERLTTVFEASKQVRQATAFGEAIIITVYVPILALTGVEGKMFHPMALTVIFALVGAFVLSLTFVPALVALIVTGEVSEQENLLVRGAKHLYRPALEFALRRRAAVIGLALAAFLGSLALAGRLGQEFVPTLDEKDIAMHAMRIPSTSLSQSTAMQLEVERVLAAFPEVALVFSKTGTAELAADPMPPNVSDTFVVLKPREEWPDPDEPKDHLRARLETALGRLPGNNLEWTQPIQMRFNELIAGVRADVAVKVFGDDFERLEEGAADIAALLKTIAGAADVKVEQTTGLPVMQIEIDRQAAARHGLSIADIQDVVAAAVGGREAGLVFAGDRRFEHIVRLPDELRGDVANLENLPVPLPRSEPAAPALHQDLLFDDDLARRGGPAFLPLGSVARIAVTEGPNQISRENGKRRVVVQCNVRGRDLGSFVAEAQERVAQLELPSGSWLAWGGQYENLVTARARLALVVPLCFLLIYGLLFGTLGSARHAALVFSGVPLGLTGGVVALWLRDMPLSISAGVGFIALSGIAVLNGLVLITFVDQLRREGVETLEAIRSGALTRLRPVLMTALVASLGFLPMALVVGGLLSSTLLTLVVLPALYSRFHRREGPRQAVRIAGG
ncbi:MAG: CusA/CzcA family heavy metal efflux RND transporter, partial [Planctomycetota bacterium]